MSNEPKRVVTKVRSHSHYAYCDWDAKEELGLSQVENGAHVNISIDVNLRESDDLHAATLVACLRRTLPALVERCEAEARDRVFPGDAKGDFEC